MYIPSPSIPPAAGAANASRSALPKPKKPIAKKFFTQEQLAAKMSSPPGVVKAISVMAFYDTLPALLSKYEAPIQKQIDTYYKSRVWKRIVKLHAEKDEISGWNWDKKRSGVKRYWCLDPERLREIRNELGRIQRYEFCDGVKVKNMYYESNFIETCVIFTGQNKLLVSVQDHRFLNNAVGKNVCRYRQEFVLDEEFYNDLAKVCGCHINEAGEYLLSECSFYRAQYSIFEVIYHLNNLPLPVQVYEREKKLQALLAVVTEDEKMAA